MQSDAPIGAIAPIAPTPHQLAWQRSNTGAFFHFGINTFHGQEWSDGTLPASSFDPTDLDAEQWVETARAAGARYAIITAKHHDGFCLWPTKTTDYSVASSPWKDGKGDVVGELAAACRAAGIGFGVYLSPWDRHAPEYADPAAYTELYTEQIRELCTWYGPLMELWFDGAGSDGYEYDWTAIMAVARKHQPDAMVFNMGDPTIRWVGNEDGLAADPVEYVVDHTQMSNYTVVTAEFAEALYLPPECDVSIRRGWFWHPDDEPKSLEHLLAIHYRSVGLGANLLLNLPPDTRGRIPDADAARVAEFGAEVARRFGTPAATAELTHGDTWTASFGGPVTFDHIRLREDLTEGQRVVRHVVRSGDRVLAEGLTVGAGRIHLTEPVTAAELTVEVVGDGAVLESVEVFETGVRELPQVPEGYRAPTDRPDE
ncbi:MULTISPECIES: alpha-L-fucosidase [unclassified Streptomyces]|uniref:alpha-L-fucosidase n=1 Tax=unclassified Streptomyces TaxID=2593676 RepID=UPI002E182F2B